MFFSMICTGSTYRYTSGYYRSNGTYVKPYYSSTPNSYKYDNWSSKGNYNPYTGARGYRNYYGW